MATDERATRGLEPLLEQITKKEEEIVTLKKAANTYASAVGLEEPFPNVGDSAGTTTRRENAIRPDQFANYSAPSTAARAFLEWRGAERGAASADEIYASLTKGGFAFEHRNAEDAKSGLRVALGKDFSVHKLPNGFYGLASWYPQAKREQRGKAAKDSAKTAADSSTTTPTPPASEEADADADA